MSKRLFGIISDKTGIPSALIVNNLNRSQAAQIAEARDKNGKVIQQQAYSIQKSVNLNGITTAADPIDAGKQITIAGENYLVDQTAQNESNTAFVEVSISAVHSDEAVITQIGEILPESGNQTISLSFITAGVDHILSGYVGSDKDGNPIEGKIQTVTPSLDGNKFTVEKGYVATSTELTVPEAQITETDKKVTIGVGYLNESKEYELASEVSDIDLSFITAGTNQILSEFTGSDKDGNPVHGSIETVYPELSDGGDIQIHIDSGYLEDSFDFKVKEGTIEVEQNRVTLGGGYYSPNMITVGEIYLDTEITPGTEDQTIPANSFIPQNLIIKGVANVNASGAFNIVKVTEYSPYVPAYPDQIGYTVDISATNHDWESGSQVDYDLSAYEGLYTVTEETKAYKGFGRTFKNANGKYLYAWTYDSWSQATDEASSAYWCISDDPSYGPDSGTIAAANSVSSGVLPDKASGWSAPMGPHTIVSCTLTPTVTSPATEAIPMVLKGSVTSAYDTETRSFTDGTSSKDYTSFEQEPYKDWYYASVGGQLIGGAVSSNVQPSCYILFDAQKSTTETGQTLELTPHPYMAEPFKTIDGVKCLDFQNGGTIKVSPVDCLITGKTPFAFSAFVRIDKKESNVYVLFAAYGTEWPPTRGFHLQLDDGYTFRLRGGNPKSSSGYDPLISTFSFPREKWVHITYVHYPEYEELYVNGTSVWWNKIKREFMESNFDYFTVGTDLNGGSFWDGYIAEFKYFSGAISQAQIKNEADRCLAMVTA